MKSTVILNPALSKPGLRLYPWLEDLSTTGKAKIPADEPHIDVWIDEFGDATISISWDFGGMSMEDTQSLMEGLDVAMQHADELEAVYELPANL